MYAAIKMTAKSLQNLHYSSKSENAIIVFKKSKLKMKKKILYYKIATF